MATGQHDRQASSSAAENGNLFDWSGVNLSQLLNVLVHNATLTASEQQVVLQEPTGNVQARWQLLIGIICGKGLQAMEMLVKTVKLQQQFSQQQRSVLSTDSSGVSSAGNSSSESQRESSVDSTRGTNQTCRDSYVSLPPVPGAEPKTPTDQSKEQKSPTLQEEISRVFAEKYGNLSNGGERSSCNRNLDQNASLTENKFAVPNGPPQILSALMTKSPKFFENSSDGKLSQDGLFNDSSAMGSSCRSAAIAGGGMKKSNLSNGAYDNFHNCITDPANGFAGQCSSSASSSNGYAHHQHDRNQRVMTAASSSATASVADFTNNEENDANANQWEFLDVALTKLPPYGFGIAVSGGRDNPHFANGDPSIAVSDVLKSGPAEGRLQINDRIISVNGVSLENVDYSYAVTILKESPTTVNLIIKRRVSLNNIPATPNNRPAPYTITLPKPTASSSKRKDDFGGLVFGCILYVKEITNRALAETSGVQIGDTVLRIGATPVDHLSFYDLKKVLEKRPKDKQCVVLQRSRGALGAVRSNGILHTANGPIGTASVAGASLIANLDPMTPPINHHRRQSSQNVYTELPTSSHVRQKSADSTDGRLIHSTRNVHPTVRSASMTLNPPRLEHPSPRIPPTLPEKLSSVLPPLPSQLPPIPGSAGIQNDPSECYSTLPHSTLPKPVNNDGQVNGATPIGNGATTSVHDCISLSSDWRFPDPRFVSFRKDGSVGLRLTGGNEAGIFVAAAQSGSPAAMAGLGPGDKILKVNDKDMKGVTREEAVLYLLNLNDQIDMVVQYRKQEFDYVLANLIGDSFYIRTHFTYEPEPKSLDLAFQPGDTFRVLDTLHTGSVGSWFVTKIGQNKLECARGSIPSASRAEELFKGTATKNVGGKSGDRNWFRRRSGRSKSLTKEKWEEMSFGKVETSFPAYERIVLKMPHFQRPIVFFGPLADVARSKLVSEFPDKYVAPQMETDGGGERSGIVRLSVIRQIMAQGKHCVLDLSCQAVDRLNYAQMYPIVLFAKADSKDLIKDIRSSVASANPTDPSKRKSTKKLLIEAQKLEKCASFLFTASVAIKNKPSWFRTICEMIEQQQQSPIWMSEKPPENVLADDFLFPMASSSIYSSGPESDAENLYDQAPVPPPRRISREESLCVKSPPLTNVTNSQNEPVYMQRPAASFYGGASSFLPSPKKTEPEERQLESENNVNIFATLRNPKSSTALPALPVTAPPRRPRPPPITVPPNHHEEQPTVRPNQSSSVMDIPTSMANGSTPSTSGTYEDPKSYRRSPNGPPYTSELSTRTLDRPTRHRLSASPKSAMDLHSSSTQPRHLHYPANRHPTNSRGESVGNGSSFGRQNGPIREEMAPPLPPKPKYLTNGRLKMFQSGFPPQMTVVRPPGMAQNGFGMGNEEAYGRLPARPMTQRCTARPVFVGNERPSTNGYGMDLPYVDDERPLSPNQFPPPPEDFLNSPKRLTAPEIIEEVRGFFDENGGVLSSEVTGVTLIIPAGAMAPGIKQEVYFKVCREDNVLSTLDKEQGERLLSPCVLCGPSGSTFLKPLELKLPHYLQPATSSLVQSVKSPSGLSSSHGQRFANGHCGTVSVFVDHF